MGLGEAKGIMSASGLPPSARKESWWADKTDPGWGKNETSAGSDIEVEAGWGAATPTGNLPPSAGPPVSREEAFEDDPPPNVAEAPAAPTEVETDAPKAKPKSESNEPTPEAAGKRSERRGNEKEKQGFKLSHEMATHDAWSVVKDPFANPFDNPGAFDIHTDFGMNKGGREREQYVEPINDPEPVPELSSETRQKLASAGVRSNDDLSLLPTGMIKMMEDESKTTQEADTNMSLLPRGWAEGESA